MYDIGICDGCGPDRLWVRESIFKNAEDGQMLRIHEYESGQELLEAVERIRFSMIMLDILQKDMDGEELARQIRDMNKHVVLVFNTGRQDVSPRSFEVQPYRYIKKDMVEEWRNHYISEALSYMAEVEKEPILMAKWNKIRLYLKLDDIVYIDNGDRMVRVHLTRAAMKKYNIKPDSGDILIKDKLLNLYQKLKLYGFGYPHSSYIINFMYIAQCTNDKFRMREYENICMCVSRKMSKEFNIQRRLYMPAIYREM